MAKSKVKATRQSLSQVRDKALGTKKINVRKARSIAEENGTEEEKLVASSAAIDPKNFKSMIGPVVSSKTITLRGLSGRGGGLGGALGGSMGRQPR